MHVAEDLLIVKNLKKYYPITGGVFGKEVGVVKAVDDVSFTVKRGETFGLVGESGCGKSTTGRSLLRLIEPTSGEVVFDGTDIIGLQGEALRKMRRNMQIVFQDPFASLNPRHNIEKILEEPLRVHGIGSPAERKERVRELLEVVGLSSYHATRYPHQFSGGRRQRIGIARALLRNPQILMLDEATSSLDSKSEIIVQQALNNLMKGRTTLVIAHRLSTVVDADQIVFLEKGRITGKGTHEELLETHAMYREFATQQLRMKQEV